MIPVFSAGIMDVEPGLVFWTLVTFGLLFFLLRWKVWGPILAAVEGREKHIRELVEGAKVDRDEARKLLEEHKKLVAEARRESAEAYRKSLADAEVARAALLVESRKEAEEITAQARRQMDDQVARARAELKGLVVDLAMDAAEKVVGEVLKDPAHQRKLVEDYVEEFGRTPRPV